ncbi:hypothetical protein FB45DRAFT_910976 [Roridomyces roridus]|uniref:Uncharacterized protein n=1 Tax=Roridomyces roridus TaxID=1738132 RepID=A0AAD7C006_9AGAR|nr:hypothetical protein FB45DRAFT_910976 [Roridomyces roridus]
MRSQHAFPLFLTLASSRPVDADTVAALIAPRTTSALRYIVTHHFTMSPDVKYIAGIPEHYGTLFSVLDNAVVGPERALTFWCVIRVSRAAESIGERMSCMMDACGSGKRTAGNRYRYRTDMGTVAGSAEINSLW